MKIMKYQYIEVKKMETQEIVGRIDVTGWPEKLISEKRLDLWANVVVKNEQVIYVAEYETSQQSL